MKKLVIIALLIVTSIGFSQSQSKRVTEFNLEKKVALQGYDPIGYFKQNKAVKGKKEIATTYDGVVYYFSSIENKNIFIKTPTKYEPQFGGWCAYAMGETGEKVEINPETFKIIEGKLYLFYNAYFNNTLKSWNKNETILKSKAEANWKKVIK